jgi:Zn-dependent protease with chaperone function
MPTHSVAINPFAGRVASRYALTELVALLASIVNSIVFPLFPILLVADLVAGRWAVVTLLIIWLGSGLFVLLPVVSPELVAWLVGARSPSASELERFAPAFDRVCRRAAVDPSRFNLRVIDPPPWYKGVWLNGAAGGLWLLALSRDALRLLDDGELEALLAHELGHLLGSDALSRSLVVWYATLAEALLRPFGWPLLSVLFRVVFWPLHLVMAFVSRPSEFAADLFVFRIGRGDALQRLLARLESNDPPTLAAALFASHPATVDRLRRLETVH